MATIYISYSRQDVDSARRLATALEERGYSVWIDTQNLAPSNVWAEQISQAIHDAEILIALLSPSAVTSRTNLHEIELAESLRKPIIPVLLSHTQIPASLARRQYIDASGEWEPFLERLIYALDANAEVGRNRKTAPAPSQQVQSATVGQPQRRAFRSQMILFTFIAIVLVALLAILISVNLRPQPADVVNQNPNANATQLPTPTPIPMVRLVIAAQNIPRGFHFPDNVKDLEVIAFYVVWPEESAPLSGIYSVDDVLGKYARVEIFREQPILTNMLVDENQILLDLTDAPAQLAQSATQIALQNATAQITSQPSETPQPTTSPTAANQSTALILATNAVGKTRTAEDATSQLVQTSESPNTSGGSDATLVALQVQSTLFVYRATEQNVLSPAEAAQIMNGAGNNNQLDLVAVVIAALAMGGTLTLLFITQSANSRSARRTGHPAAHPNLNMQVQQAPPEKLLEEYQIFISSSEKDKEWVNILVEDLLSLDYLVWWYVKDAPGLPFGNEIRSAIFHTKIFVIILSPDSMKSKHIEEEIRWAEIYDRPIIPVVCRSIAVEERLYGLAKGADINFSDEAEYKNSLELLTQAVDHYLKKRLEPVQGDSSVGTP